MYIHIYYDYIYIYVYVYVFLLSSRDLIFMIMPPRNFSLSLWILQRGISFIEHQTRAPTTSKASQKYFFVFYFFYLFFFAFPRINRLGWLFEKLIRPKIYSQCVFSFLFFVLLVLYDLIYEYTRRNCSQFFVANSSSFPCSLIETKRYRNGLKRS